jgi:hypothetical protein
LKIARNDIGCSGAVGLAGALRHPSTLLQQLDLTGNAIQCSGLAALVDSLAFNSHLRRLFVTGNMWRHSKRHLAERRAVQDGFLAVLVNANKTLWQLELDRATTSTADDFQQQQQLLLTALGRPLHCLQQELAALSQIEWYLQLNRLGRDQFGNVQIHPTAWTRVLGRAAGRPNNMDLVLALLKARPDLLSL